MTKQITASVEHKDIIVSFLSGIIDFCKRNKQGVLTALVILVLAAVIGSFYSNHLKKVTQDSWAGYYTAQVALLSGEEQEGFKLIDQLTEKYPGTDAAQYAVLLTMPRPQTRTKRCPLPKTRRCTPWPRSRWRLRSRP